MLLPMLATVAQARPYDWQAELDRCRVLREQMGPTSASAPECRASPCVGSSQKRILLARRFASTLFFGPGPLPKQRANPDGGLPEQNSGDIRQLF